MYMHYRNIQGNKYCLCGKNRHRLCYHGAKYFAWHKRQEFTIIQYI